MFLFLIWYRKMYKVGHASLIEIFYWYATPLSVISSTTLPSST
ncbi:hypothetical protein SBF1_2390008 [Candidatus Desulfosporosinus infrequens]|uniref:Uncharacterized protein n=1 Tax=Candidatus Desulfosporosinus infrequens TaxID=2043169 RepID=A0A2U3KN33_9FIRM|nr:hypothetical protein SBF1_2390008 [Candidatus Desulfosporosinus infrequens]